MYSSVYFQKNQKYYYKIIISLLNIVKEEVTLLINEGLYQKLGHLNLNKEEKVNEPLLNILTIKEK